MLTSLLLAPLAVALGASATPLYTPAHAPPPSKEFGAFVGHRAPLHTNAVDQGHEAIKNSYIVVLKPDTPPSFLDSHIALVAEKHAADPFSSSLDADEGAGVKNVYASETFLGYAGTFSEDLVERIRQEPAVDFIERDSVVYTQDKELGAPWGLARISHREKLRLSTFSKYEYDSTAGEGVDIYVVDTGINVEHVEFEGRASWGKTIPKNDVDKDGNGHGTHCAGTIASRKYGVAKKAHVIAVKVLGSNGSGSMSDVVDGVLFAAEQAKKKATLAAAELAATGSTKHVGSVASMSLGGGSSPALDRAVNTAVKSGLHFAVAAGNDNKDACNYSPAAADLAITVGASTIGDERAYFSNHGPCVDIFAPGLNILSTWNTNNISTNTISGTSMATPHIAGLLGYLLSIYGSETFLPAQATLFDLKEPAKQSFTSKIVSLLLPSYASTVVSELFSITAPVPPKKKTLTPAELKKALIKLGSVGLISGELPEGTPNILAFNNYTVPAGK